MEVILIQKVDNLGTIGSIVKVKNGFGRNYLIPRKIAIRATEANKKLFEAQRVLLEKENQEKKTAAERDSKKLVGAVADIIRQAGDDGRLFGSVSARDVADALSEMIAARVTYDQVRINNKIKEIGMYDIEVALHPEVKEKVIVNIARTEEEAKDAKKAMLATPEEKKAAKAEAAGSRGEPKRKSSRREMGEQVSEVEGNSTEIAEE
jgi:large subunit ribosomal protein L9